MKIDTGPLSLANVDQQFCSDWLKAEIKRIINERDEARAMLLDLGVAQPQDFRL